MNILEQLKQAQAAREATVNTLSVLKMGETFEFGGWRSLSVGDHVKISLQYQPTYGWAQIIEKTSGGGFIAKRVK